MAPFGGTLGPVWEAGALDSVAASGSTFAHERSRESPAHPPHGVEGVGIVTTDVGWSIVLVLGFILVGGVFAGAELALVSLRDSQIDQLAKRGKRGARVARVARNPNRFLAAVQIGVTVAGFISAAYGASALAPAVAPAVEALGASAEVSLVIATVALTLVIAYLSLVLGELVPKRFALQRAQAIALAVAPALDRFATVVRPVIWLLSRSTDAVVRLLGGDPQQRSEEMSGEELRDLVHSHRALPADARRIVSDVLGVGERTVAEVLRHRGDVSFLDDGMTVAQARAVVGALPHSRYPVTRDGVDDVIGFLHVRDLLNAPDAERVGALARPILHVPTTALVMPVLAQMRHERQQIAIVVDEYGGTDGIVTFEDLLEEIVGDISDEYDPPAPRASAASPREFDAALSLEDFADAAGIVLPDGPYETVAGYVLARLGRLAKVGDQVGLEAESSDGGDASELTLTVVAVEGRRLKAVRVDEAPAGSQAPGR